MPTNFWDWVKLVGPYLIEVIRVILNGPHTIAMDNLREKGVIKESK